jgi:hypothetical protein
METFIEQFKLAKEELAQQDLQCSLFELLSFRLDELLGLAI